MVIRALSVPMRALWPPARTIAVSLIADLFGSIYDSISISTSLFRDDRPDFMEMLDLGTSNSLAKRVINSLFALPSTGGDCNWTIKLPSDSWAIACFLEFGLTLTFLNIYVIDSLNSISWGMLSFDYRRSMCFCQARG